MLPKIGLILIILLSLTFTFPAATSAEEFYRGKTIQLFVGSQPGGGFDIMTRTIAKHIGKHIPGSPSTIVGYMPGAGHLILIRYMNTKAKPDGLTIANFIGTMVLGQRLGFTRGRPLDFRDFGWLGVPMQDHLACVLNRQSGISNLKEWRASKRPLKFGGDAPGNSLYDFPKILKAALGLPMRVIAGYAGSAPVMLAIESGEIDGGCWTWQVMRLRSRRQLEAGDIRVVLQAGPRPYEDLKGVPLAIDEARSERGRKLIEVGIQDRSAILRPYSVSPKTRKDRLSVLQKAFMDTMNDPEFLADAKKLQFDINPTDGPTTAQIVARTYDVDPSVLSELKQAILGQ